MVEKDDLSQTERGEGTRLVIGKNCQFGNSWHVHLFVLASGMNGHPFGTTLTLSTSTLYRIASFQPNQLFRGWKALDFSPPGDEV